MGGARGSEGGVAREVRTDSIRRRNSRRRWHVMGKTEKWKPGAPVGREVCNKVPREMRLGGDTKRNELIVRTS